MKGIELPSTTNRYYWVPESMLYATAGDCLDARPNDGAAALVVSDVAYRELEQKLAVATKALEHYAKPGIHERWKAEEALALIKPDAKKAGDE